MVTENGQGVVQSGNSKETQQQKIAKAAEVKENKEQPETTFDKNFVRICLYVIPIALFFALFDFSNISSLVTGSTGINYVACYGLYIIVIELARKLHTDDKESTHARHVFNQSFVYFPLALFLFTASYALYSAGSEVFGVQPAEQRQAFVQEVDKFLDTYKAQCTQASASTKEQHQCIESYLNATLFADVKLIQEKYGDASNSYSIIAIMTGFFGVLMTVLVIYFSLSGRELLEHKLIEANDLIKRQQKIVDEIEKFREDVLNSAETTNQRLSNVEKQVKIKGSEDKDTKKELITNNSDLGQITEKSISSGDESVKNNDPDDQNKYKEENQTNIFSITDEIKTNPHVELDARYSFRFKLFIGTDYAKESAPIIDEIITSPSKLDLEKWVDAVNKGAQLLVIHQINEQGATEKIYGPFIHRA